VWGFRAQCVGGLLAPGQLLDPGARLRLVRLLGQRLALLDRVNIGYSITLASLVEHSLVVIEPVAPDFSCLVVAERQAA
jgi:hypothetical protein